VTTSWLAFALVATAGGAGAEHAASSFVPFWQPLPVWDYWYLLLVPLCLGVSIVYKSIKCHRMSQVPREAGVIFLMILAGMTFAAAALMALVRVMEKVR
jgi:hypothetical protein